MNLMQPFLPDLHAYKKLELPLYGAKQRGNFSGFGNMNFQVFPVIIANLLILQRLQT